MKQMMIKALLLAAGMAVATSPALAQNEAAPAAQAAPQSSKQADRALAKAVRRALSKTPGFDVSGVFVKARGGAVTLSGSVKDGSQITQAEEVARSVQGVTSVSNKLTLFHGGNG
ncbi:BON domain-containing protein [Paraburkholderia rhizosphaerae]|jgi:osmotically-inducible protein OsmY|uniref:BON domain-containing protein n=1 Tax=Paraburkholderia rhizosphaerae TaxID=480658 RepID=A0A4R8M2H7_9BURK|nr:BON domain-containing protein [Paraburkholderia rhizosphaerae]TDY54618.1 BON domain-containing protein [Paraburkholderia rhizosphaerae]